MSSDSETNTAIAQTFTRREILQYAGFAGLGLAAPTLLASDGDPEAGHAVRSPRYAATIRDARIAIAQAMAETQTPSISVALCDGERILWRETFGYIDRAKSIPPGLNTLFCVGSCSKVIAAIATMILVDRGLVDLDAPLVQYVTDFRMASRGYTDITVRMLLSHASGLPGTHNNNICTFSPFRNYAAQAQQALAGQRLKHQPGKMAVYCNDGFTLIEPLVAAVTGRSYPRFVRDAILVPLGMRQSQFPLTRFPNGSYAPAFREDGRPWPQECLNAYAAGGLYTTPSEMTRLARMLINGGAFAGVRILSPDAVAEMGRDQTATLTFNPIPTTRWGLGWDGVAQPGLAAVGVTAWHKNGGTSFYGSDFFVAPKERLALIITGTTTTYGTGALAERILLNALAEQGHIPYVPAPLPAVPPPEQPVTDAQLAAMVGFYAHSDGLFHIESQADRRLTMKQYNAGRWDVIARDLKRRDDGTFVGDAQPLSAIRMFSADGRRYLALRQSAGLGHYLSEIPWAQKVKPASALSPVWQARAGRFGLPVNEHADSVVMASSAPRLILESVEELPGYLLGASGIVDPSDSNTRARMFLKIPVSYGRNLDDVVIETRDGEEWMRCNGWLFRPQAGVPDLVVGKNLVTIGTEGLAEWHQLPATGASATITGAGAWKLYDADFALLAGGKGDGHTGAYPKGAYLLLYGAPADVIRVRILRQFVFQG